MLENLKHHNYFVYSQKLWIGFWKHLLQSNENNMIHDIITETSLYSFGNFRKLSLYNCFMPSELINSL